MFVDSKAVAAAGTPELLTTRDLPVSCIAITAKDTNTGVIYVVDIITKTKKWPHAGIPAGGTVTFSTEHGTIDIRAIWIDSSVNGEGVDWVAF